MCIIESFPANILRASENDNCNILNVTLQLFVGSYIKFWFMSFLITYKVYIICDNTIVTYCGNLNLIRFLIYIYLFIFILITYLLWTHIYINIFSFIFCVIYINICIFCFVSSSYIYKTFCSIVLCVCVKNIWQ